MDITKISVAELKALAYDSLVQLDAIQKNLQIINAELAKRNESPKGVKEDKKK